MAKIEHVEIIVENETLDDKNGNNDQNFKQKSRRGVSKYKYTNSSNSSNCYYF